MDARGTHVDLRRIGLAAGGSVLASVAWYTAWGSRLAELDEAYADGGPPAAWVLPVELARSGAVATAVALLSRSTGSRDPGSAARLGLGLWGASPSSCSPARWCTRRCPGSWPRSTPATGWSSSC